MRSVRADVGVGSAEYTKEGAPLAYGKNRSAPSEEEENSARAGGVLFFNESGVVF
jgi:hypothetical protein